MLRENLENYQKYVKVGWEMGMTPPPFWDNVPDFGVFSTDLLPKIPIFKVNLDREFVIQYHTFRKPDRNIIPFCRRTGRRRNLGRTGGTQREGGKS